MSAVLSLLSLLALTMITSALFAYPIYQFFGEQLDLPFHKIISRLLLIIGLIFSIVFLNVHKILNSASLGFKPGESSKTRTIFQGILIGIVIVLVLEASLVTLGIHVFTPDIDNSISALVLLLIKASIAGLLVALIEETIFRGAIFSLLLKNLSIAWAMIISSAFYSAVHFINIPEFSGTEVNWLSGLSLLPHSLDFLFRVEMIDLFITLFVLGLFFALLRLKTGNNFLCIGVHAGIVMMVKIANYFTDYQTNSDYDFLVNSVNHQMGHLATGWLSLLFILFYYRYKHSDKLNY